MMRRSIKSRKVVELILKLGAVSHGETKTAENGGALLYNARKRMLDAKPPPAASHSQISVNRLLCGNKTLGGKSCLNLGAPRLHGLAKHGTLLLWNILHRFDKRGD